MHCFFLLNGLAKMLMSAIGFARPRSRPNGLAKPATWSSPRAVWAIAALAIPATSCDPITFGPDTDQIDTHQQDIWLATATVVKALGGRAKIDLGRISTGRIGIKVLSARTSRPALAAADADPICSRSFNAGFWERLRFAKCVSDAVENDVCGNGGTEFELEVLHETEEFHIHCLS